MMKNSKDYFLNGLAVIFLCLIQNPLENEKWYFFLEFFLKNKFFYFRRIALK
jgi:hypothetical protein